MGKGKILTKYFNLVIVSYCILVFLRLLETILIIYYFGFENNLIFSELGGVIFDFLIINTFLLVLYPIYLLIFRKNESIANSVFLILISLLSILHIIILKYFLYQLIPLNIFLFQYSLNEILFTITSSGINYLNFIFLILVLLLVIFSSNRFSRRFNYSKKLIKAGYFFIYFSLPVLIITQIFFTNKFNKYTQNKSFYFYSQTATYFLKMNKIYQPFNNKDAQNIQQLYPHKTFINSEYPLLHVPDTLNSLGSCFNKFDTAPNIVILIVEGLNDDFIHKYKGVDLMPFLSKLKNRSLYWNRCFTTGERSFSVVPSILGSLPYGQKGFTLLEKLPTHLSLVSILNSNKYFTSFFYGQGSWFHQKDRFFKYNDLNLLIDSRNFSNKYDKIIVGEDNFFWGYNDKDLFNQSFEIIDTISAKPRLDIYFTGTSHSPFKIANEDYYEKYFSDVLGKLKSSEDLDFFYKYKKYIKSIFFVNDALRDFFNNYEKRVDYKNTIFIITGDHPMTEIPISNSLKRYHVPLIIFSEKLIKSQTVSNIVSHLDIPESILSLLKPYGINIPNVSTALGDKLYVGINSESEKVFFMDDNREIIDYYSTGYFLSGEQVYEVDENLNISEINDKKIFNRLNKELNIFKKTNLFVCLNNKIIPESEYCKSLNYPIFYSSHKTDSIKFSTEFHDFFPPLKVNNKEFIYNIEFNYTGSSTDISFVYELRDSNDSIIIWKNLGIPKGNSFQEHITINYEGPLDSIMYFKSYFGNPTNKEFKYSDLNILIHGLFSGN